MAVELDKKTGKYMFAGKIYKDGKCIKRYRKRGFDSKWEAQKAEVEFRKDFFMLPSDMNFDRLYKAFKEYNKKYVKESTLKSDEYLYNVLSKEMKDIDFLDKRQMQNLINKFDEKYSKAYVSRIYFFLNKLYKFGVTSEYIQSNPMTYVKRDLRLNERKEEMTIWQQYDFDLFIEEVDEQMMKCFYSVLFYMGLRKGEAMALQWKDIDFRKQTIDINKTYRYKEKDPNKWLTPPKTNNSYRTITMPKFLSDEYKEFKEMLDVPDKSFVFGIDIPVCNTTVRTRMREAIKLANENNEEQIPIIRIHDLRHSCASYMIGNMVRDGSSHFSLYDVAKRLGDNLSTVLSVYAHWLPQADKGIAKFMDKDNALD